MITILVYHVSTEQKYSPSQSELLLPAKSQPVPSQLPTGILDFGKMIITLLLQQTKTNDCST